MIKRCVLIVGILWSLTVSVPVTALEPVITDNIGESVILGKYYEILEDSGGKWGIDDILTEDIQKLFKRSAENIPYFGYTKSAYWVKLKIRSVHDTRSEWILELLLPLMDRIDLYRPSEKKGEKYIKYTTGYNFPFSQREIDHKNFLFILKIPKGAEKTYYLRFENSDRMEIPLTLWTDKAFHSDDRLRQNIFGLFYGIIIVMVLYNFILYTTLLDRTYLYYIFYILAFIVLMLNMNGYFYKYFWPDALSDYNHFIPHTFLLLLFCGVLFTQSFLGTKRINLHLHRILSLLKYSSILIILPMIFMPHMIKMILANALISVTLVILLIIGVISYLKKYRPAFFFMLAWSTFLLGVIVFVFKTWGILPNNFITNYSIQIGAGIKVIFLSLGLADRISLLVKEKAEMEKEMIIARRIQDDTLPGQIPVLPGIDISAVFKPLDSVSGDFYGYHIHKKKNIGIFISDVTGHGVPAALISSMVNIIFHTHDSLADKPDRLFSTLNRHLTGNIGNLLLTAEYVYFDLKKKKILCANAGHFPVLVYKKIDNELLEVKPHGRVIGWDEECDYDIDVIDIEAGDKIIMYTDGLTEACNEQNEMFGEFLLKKIIKEKGVLSASELSDYIIMRLNRWIGSAKSLNDDLTIIIAEIQ